MNNAAAAAAAEGGEVLMGAAKADRGNWAPRVADVASLRQTLGRLCGASSSSASSSSSSTSGEGKSSGGESGGGGGVHEGKYSYSGGGGKDSRSTAAEAAARATLESAPCMFGGGGGGEGGDYHHVVMYQRNTGRRLEGADRAAVDLAAALGPAWRVSTVTHHERLPPCLLAKCLGNAGALVTPHGFQSMLYLFLAPGALLFEAFPHRYYKHGYKRAALEWGLSYGMTLSPPRGWLAGLISRSVTTAKCMSMYYCRYLARKVRRRIGGFVSFFLRGGGKGVPSIPSRLSPFLSSTNERGVTSVPLTLKLI